MGTGLRRVRDQERGFRAFVSLDGEGSVFLHVLGPVVVGRGVVLVLSFFLFVTKRSTTRSTNPRRTDPGTLDRGIRGFKGKMPRRGIFLRLSGAYCFMNSAV